MVLLAVDRSVVLPAYNEQEYISEMVDRCVKALEQRPGTFEVIVIDNCSTDRTAGIVDEIHARDSRVRVIRHETNKLYAGSCQTGASNAEGEHIFILDSDGQIDPQEIWAFDAKLDEGNDIVFGRRVDRDDPRMRLLVSKIFLMHAKVLIDYELDDVNTGIRGMTSEYAQALELKYRVNMANPEMYVRAKMGGFRISQTDIRQHERQGGVSSHQFAKLWQIEKTVVNYLWSLRNELKSGRRSSSRRSEKISAAS